VTAAELDSKVLAALREMPQSPSETAEALGVSWTAVWQSTARLLRAGLIRTVTKYEVVP
jgi:DNA-binding Lrp family transcriptional regulator